MEATHRGKITMPFYALPPTKKTSAEIISEARAAIGVGDGRLGIRPVDTKRPFTPRERQRTLFGTSTKPCRPPSSFSLRYLQFEEIDTQPPPGMRLVPLSASVDHPNWKTLVGAASIQDGKVSSIQTGLFPSSAHGRIKLPSIGSAGKLHRLQFRTASLCNLPEEIEEESSTSDGIPLRKAFSGPKERTAGMDEMLSPEQNGKRPMPSGMLGTSTCSSIQEDPSVDGSCGGVVKKVKLKKKKKCSESSEMPEDSNASDLHLSDLESSMRSEKSLKILKTESIKPTKKDTQDMKTSSTNNSIVPVLSSTENESFDESHSANIKKDSWVGQQTKGTVSKRDKNGSSRKRTSSNKSKSAYSERSENTKPSETISKKTTPTETNVPNTSSQTRGPSSEENSSLNYAHLHPTVNSVIKCVNSDCEDSNNSDIAISVCSTESEERKDNFDSIQSILGVLNILANDEENDADVIVTLEKLYSTLESEGFCGGSVNPRYKAQVLKSLYRFVERSNERLLLQIARIILALRVTGSNLSGVCKLVFKVSRCDKNDKLFLEDDILELFLEALGSASPLEDAEACVYGYGALKFLTMNNTVLHRVLKLGILELMVLHMKLINILRLEGGRVPEQTSHALFQLTGTLRNVAGEDDMFSSFVATGAVLELCRAMELFASDLDVISNVSRTLSIISTHDDCCLAIIEYENTLKFFVVLFQKYPGRQDIMVRLGYALGNLMAKSDIARMKFYNVEGSMDSMINLLTIYLDKDIHLMGLSQNESSKHETGSNGSVEDVIVKMIRIIANMSINPDVGSCIARNGHVLDVLLTVLCRKSVLESEELVLSTLSTLNNLSFYPLTLGDSVERQLDIAEALCPLVLGDHIEGLVEATRVFGNLTRSKEIRDYVVESGVLQKLLQLLDLENRELLYTTIGILINMMADPDKRGSLKEGKGVARLTNVLCKMDDGDWQLACLVCQVLWNYIIETENLLGALGKEETEKLLSILADYLDEERLFGITEGTEVDDAIVMSLAYQMWEEFAGVATSLLEKIEAFLDRIESLKTQELDLEPLEEFQSV